MKLRAIFWVATAGILCVSGIIYFSAPEKTASPAPRIFTAQTAVVPTVTAPAPAVLLVDDQLLQTATNGASAEFALDLQRKWLADDPLDTKARVAKLMLALCNAGKFRTALALANAAPAELQTNWLQLTFQRWAQRQPQDAVKSFDAIADPVLRSAALRAATDGWNQNNPGGLAAYAVALPDSDDRAYALAEALDNWSLQDPAALATWLNTLPRGIEFDAGAAWMVAKTDGANRLPSAAMEWVENISDPALQLDSFHRVIAEWAQTDRKSAEQYVSSANWLDARERATAWDSLAAH